MLVGFASHAQPPTRRGEYLNPFERAHTATDRHHLVNSTRVPASGRCQQLAVKAAGRESLRSIALGLGSCRPAACRPPYEDSAKMRRLLGGFVNSPSRPSMESLASVRYRRSFTRHSATGRIHSPVIERWPRTLRRSPGAARARSRKGARQTTLDVVDPARPQFTNQLGASAADFSERRPRAADLRTGSTHFFLPSSIAMREAHGGLSSTRKEDHEFARSRPSGGVGAHHRVDDTIPLDAPSFGSGPEWASRALTHGSTRASQV